MKREFNHVTIDYLPRNMEDIGGHGDLVRWTESFMLYRSVSLYINGH